MRLMANPRKPHVDENPAGIYWHDDPAKLERLCLYCRRDVEVERELFRRLPQLIDTEQQTWALDAVINARGFFTDEPLLEASYNIVTSAEAALQSEFRELTGLDSTNQVEKFIGWLAERGCDVTDAQKSTLKAALRRKNLEPTVRRAIELRLQLAHASATKIEALLAWRNNDGRVRGSLQYHGAATGRWVGRGPQPQNLRRDGDGIDAKIAAIMAGGAGLTSPVEAVGDIGRATIVAAPGHRILVGDFSGIESRLLAWAAGEQRKLDQWVRFDNTGDVNDDPYVVIGRSFGHPHDKARASGKIGDLAFGYQGGVGAWQNFAPEDDASDETTIKSYRDRWRAEHPRTVQFWYAVDRAAINAVQHPGIEYRVRQLVFRFEAPFLRITLPSGRSIAYPSPRIETNRFDHLCVVFKDSAGGKWTDCNFGRGAYGGLWTENIISGIARDLLAGALQRLEAAGYPAVLHVHDEVVVEAPDGFGSLEEFQRIITAVPDWAQDLPITAKVREGQRFSKPSAPARAAATPAPASAAVITDDIKAAATGDDDDDDPLAELLDGGADGAGGAGDPELNDRLDDIGAGDGADDRDFGTPNILSIRGGDKPEEPKLPIGGMFADGLAAVAAGAEQRDDASKLNSGAAPHVKGNGRDQHAGKIHCPFHNDKTPSLQIYGGDDPHYYCFGCNKHGPLSDLSKELLTTTPSSRAQADDAETLAYAHRVWDEAKSIAGTLAERYLTETRGIDVGALPPDIDKVLRFHPRCLFNEKGHLPCLLALYRDVETDAPAGIHRIALPPEVFTGAKVERLTRALVADARHQAVAGGQAIVCGEGSRPCWPLRPACNGTTRRCSRPGPRARAGSARCR